ncbi:hypothetical protein [Yoonia algicola]|uniref:Transferrin-binding protein B C-lobe/N-lobe beta barrel domain-containing protein n=1 Tax=Yoonia algicola TaxID=3137368 RepID=A0AAN0M4L1_9RHOB
MFKNFKLCASTAAIVLVAGCGGGGAGGPTYEDLTDEFLGLAERAPVIDSERFLASDLPETGGANYNGVIGIFSSSEDFALLGDLQMTASFSDDTISGGADSFSNSDGETYSGRIPIRNGIIFRDDLPDLPTFEADFDGELVFDPTGDVIVVNTDMIGDFYGDQYEFVSGIVLGTLSSEGEVVTVGTTTDDSDAFSVFIAER